jgi:hypothetical protein
MKTFNRLIIYICFCVVSVSSSEVITLWPWNQNNETENRTRNACNTKNDCDSCTSTFGCHWCSFDESCHAKGSIHGCLYGETCPYNKTDHSCASHNSCTECALSSNLCHWCAFDDQCHAIGSVHGCIRGVDCYSNNRCQRLESEPIEEGIFQDIGFVPLFFIFMLGSIVMCFSTVLYTSASALKSIYEDWVQEREEFYTVVGDGRSIMGMSMNIPMTVSTPASQDLNSPTAQALAFQTPPFQSPPPRAFHKNLAVLREEESSQPDEDSCDDNVDQDLEEQDAMEQRNSPQDDHSLEEDHDDIHMENCAMEPLLPVSAVPDPSRLPRSTMLLSNSGPVTCLHKSCRIWYVFTMILTMMLIGCSIVFFPKTPQYNVCNDEFAWKSIIDSFAHLNMEASFEVLMSVENRNRLDVTLDGFGGTFSHEGENVGTWTLRKSVIRAMSITDVMLTCTVAPDRWEALGLISDFYRGRLMVMVDVQGSVRVPGIFYSIPVKMNDILVKVNDPDNKDRHLCACPEWKDLSPTTAPVLSFEAAVIEPVSFGSVAKK